MYNKTFIRSR